MLMCYDMAKFIRPTDSKCGRIGKFMQESIVRFLEPVRLEGAGINVANMAKQLNLRSSKKDSVQGVLFSLQTISTQTGEYHQRLRKADADILIRWIGCRPSSTSAATLMRTRSAI